ncbi:MAG TPA: hypothetical protein VD793_06765 [Gemmatimonadales bacterium]|nr:hypothetical protein [Gemmatimonadales bacterium]
MSVSIFRAATKPRGDRRWDLFIRAAGVVALIAIPLAILFPSLVPLIWLLVVSLPANSPLSPILPTLFEPIIMEAAKYERATWVTLTAAVGSMYMEYINWHAYGWLLDRKSLAGFRAHTWVVRGVRYFSWTPFLTVVVFAFTPLPFWAARILAILHGYPVGRFMVATLVGRLPRWFLYAWFGAALRVPAWILAAVIVGGSGVVVAQRLFAHQPLLADPVADAQTPAAPDAQAGDGDLRRSGT